MRLDNYITKRGRGAQSELARACGVSHATINRIRTGGAVPGLALAMAIEAHTDGAVCARDLCPSAPKRPRRRPS